MSKMLKYVRKSPTIELSKEDVAVFVKYLFDDYILACCEAQEPHFERTDQKGNLLGKVNIVEVGQVNQIFYMTLDNGQEFACVVFTEDDMEAAIPDNSNVK